MISRQDILMSKTRLFLAKILGDLFAFAYGAAFLAGAQLALGAQPGTECKAGDGMDPPVQRA